MVRVQRWVALVAVTAGIGVLAGYGWALVAGGVLLFAACGRQAVDVMGAWRRVRGAVGRAGPRVVAALEPGVTARRVVAVVAMAAGLVALPLGVALATSAGIAVVSGAAVLIGVSLLTGWNA